MTAHRAHAHPHGLNRRGVVGRLVLCGVSALCGAALPGRIMARDTAGGGPISIFAAASLSGVLERIFVPAQAADLPMVRLVTASSGALARQIAAGAPADLFLSAHERWMNWLAARGFLARPAETLAGNRLALILPRNTPTPPENRTASGLPIPDRGRLAIGDPGHVPAGIYARQALQRLGLWPELQPRLALTGNARAALALVERGAVSAGIVYLTDAQASRRIGHIGHITPLPAHSHAPVRYLAGIVRGGHEGGAAQVLKQLHGPRATAIFREYGFLLPADDA